MNCTSSKVVANHGVIRKFVPKTYSGESLPKIFAAGRDAKLLFQFAQRRVRTAFARLERSSGQPDLPGVKGQRFRAQQQRQMPLAGAAV